MATRGRDFSSRRRPEPHPQVDVPDEAVSGLVRHPAWSITKTDRGLVYSRAEDAGSDVAAEADIGPDQVTRLVKHIGKAFEGSDEQVLLRSRSSSGTDRDLEVHLRPIVADGAVREVLGSTIALREPDEEISGDRQQLARTVVESAQDCIVVMDHEGWIVEFNPAAERSFGYSREEALNLRVEDLMSPEAVSLHKERLARYLETGDSTYLDVRLEMMMRRADATLFPVEVTATTIPDREPPLFVGFIRDLTDCKRTEEALLESELTLTAIAEHLPDLVYHYRLRPDRAFDYVSPASSSLLGYQASEFYANPGMWRRIVHPQDLPLMLHAIQGDPSISSFHVRCVHKDGTIIHCQLSNSVVRDDRGKAVATVGVLRDETERIETLQQLRTSAEQLREADAERLRLSRRLVAAHEEERRSIAAAIHDDSIQAVAALAIRVSTLRRKATDEAMRGSLGEVEQSVSEAVSRLRRLMFELHPTTLDRGGLATTVEAYLGQFTGEDEPTYALDNKLRSEPEQSARLALYRIIQEAITNARKHGHARNILVLLDQTEEEYVARIHDDGRGFPVAEIESPAGHLGLSTMREQAEMAGGSISIDSNRAGTTVEARIPIQIPPKGG